MLISENPPSAGYRILRIFNVDKVLCLVKKEPDWFKLSLTKISLEIEVEQSISLIFDAENSDLRFKFFKCPSFLVHKVQILAVFFQDRSLNSEDYFCRSSFEQLVEIFVGFASKLRIAKNEKAEIFRRFVAVSAGDNLVTWALSTLRAFTAVFCCHVIQAKRSGLFDRVSEDIWKCQQRKDEKNGPKNPSLILQSFLLGKKLCEFFVSFFKALLKIGGEFTVTFFSLNRRSKNSTVPSLQIVDFFFVSFSLPEPF